MGAGRGERHDRYVDKARAELSGLVERGVLMAGNAFSRILLLKGEPNQAERDDAPLLSGADGVALRAALQALGYAPQEWAGLATWNQDGTPLSSDLLREAICTLDPDTLIVCDATAADAVREVFAEELAMLERFEEAMLADGTVALVLGMRVMALGGFEAALSEQHQKQVMWHRLKQLPPLGEPY